MFTPPISITHDTSMRVSFQSAERHVDNVCFYSELARAQPSADMQLLPLQLFIHIFGFLGQGDGVQVEVAVENGGAASESSSEGAGEAAQEQILTCSMRRETKQEDSFKMYMIFFFWIIFFLKEPEVRCE